MGTKQPASPKIPIQTTKSPGHHILHPSSLLALQYHSPSLTRLQRRSWLLLNGLPMVNESYQRYKSGRQTVNNNPFQGPEPQKRQEEKQKKQLRIFYSPAEESNDTTATRVSKTTQ